MYNYYDNQKFFTTIQDVCEAVRLSLQEWEEDYDIEAIAHEVTEWNDQRHCLEMIEDTEEFWRIVAKHELVQQN